MMQGCLTKNNNNNEQLVMATPLKQQWEPKRSYKHNPTPNIMANMDPQKCDHPSSIKYTTGLQK